MSDAIELPLMGVCLEAWNISASSACRSLFLHQLESRRLEICETFPGFIEISLELLILLLIKNVEFLLVLKFILFLNSRSIMRFERFYIINNSLMDKYFGIFS